MIQNLTAIETIYRGYRMRSRLEGRYAVFLDAMEIEWDYEAEGFKLPSGWYLPDFWIPSAAVFAEVKPVRFNPREIALASELVKASERPLLMLEGAPHGGTYRMMTADGITDFRWKNQERVELAVAAARGARFGERQEQLTAADAMLGLPRPVAHRIAERVIGIERK